MGSIPGQRPKIPHALGSKKKFFFKCSSFFSFTSLTRAWWGIHLGRCPKLGSEGSSRGRPALSCLLLLGSKPQAREVIASVQAECQGQQGGGRSGPGSLVGAQPVLRAHFLPCWALPLGHSWLLQVRLALGASWWSLGIFPLDLFAAVCAARPRERRSAGRAEVCGLSA